MIMASDPARIECSYPQIELQGLDTQSCQIYPILINNDEPQIQHSQKQLILQSIVTKLLRKCLNYQLKEDSLRYLLSLDRQLVSFKDNLIDRLHELLQGLDSFDDRYILTSQNELKIVNSYAVDNINNLLMVLKEEDVETFRWNV